MMSTRVYSPLTSAPKLKGVSIGIRSELPEKNTFIHFKDVEDDGGAVIPTNTCPGSVESKSFQGPAPLSSAAHVGIRTLPEGKASVRFDGGEDSPASTSSNPVYSWVKTMDTFDSIDDGSADGHDELLMAVPKSKTHSYLYRTELPEKNTFVHFDDADIDGGALIPTKTCPGLVESKTFQIAVPMSNVASSGFRTELPEKKSCIRFDDVDDDGGALASPTIVFSWARTMDPFDSIDNVQEYGGPENLGKSCSRSVDKKEFQIPAPMSNTAYGGILTELPEKKPSIRFDDGEDSPAVTSPIMAFSWARTMDPFECVDDVQNDGGLAESEELSTRRNLQNEALHLRGECQPCAYFALRADGCRRGKLCEFCHLCDKKEIKRRKRQYRKNVK